VSYVRNIVNKLAILPTRAATPLEIAALLLGAGDRGDLDEEFMIVTSGLLLTTQIWRAADLKI
jgi:hypothetical protein